MQAFLDQLLQAAGQAGIEACEAYMVERDSFGASAMNGEVTEHKSNMTRGLGFRGLYKGRMGYASTEAFDEEAIGQLVKGVLESAELSEDTDKEFLYEGKDSVPEMNLCNRNISDATADEKTERMLAMEKAIREADSHVEKTETAIETERHTVRIVNSYGMNRTFTEDVCVMMGQANAKDGNFVSSGYSLRFAHDFDKMDAQAIGRDAAKRAVDGLNATSISSGKYHVVLLNETMTSLMGVFSGIFSAEVSQKGMSLLKGKLGQSVAAPCMTIVDDPLRADGMESRPFDAEGVPSAAHIVVENGVFRTFLHNLKTAHKDGVQTTGNASKAGYASSVHVSPSNFYIKPGTKNFDELLTSIGDGLVITDVSGLHAGANPVSGDFSLLSKGYTFKNGKREKAVEQITVAGNFYELLKNTREVAADLYFPYGGMGSPSLDVGELSVSGC